MNAIEIKNLSKSYRSTPALSNINLSLERGKIIGLLGPNGCGKTTLMKILAGLSSDYSGTVSILGHQPGPESKAALSFLPERSSLNPSHFVSESLRLYADYFADFNLTKAKDMLASFRIEPQMRIKELSKGMQEKLQIALAMSRDAQIYLLDEPISGVDPASRSIILQNIIKNYSESALLLLSTHLIADVESILDRVLLMDRGQIILDRDAESLRAESGKSIDQYFREVFICSAS